jgi:phosphoribosylanthranilate isomerase
MTRVKICGMMRPQDVEASSDADYLGFVVNTGTRRSLTIEKARELMSTCSVPRVVVVTDTDAEALSELVSALEPEVLQISAAVSEGMLKKVKDDTGCELWAVVHVGNGNEEARVRMVKDVADAVVFDTYSPAGGGAGAAHDWSASSRLKTITKSRPAILAGGLDSDNVECAIRAVDPFAVDVSSGVEVNGAKDPGRIRDFIRKVRRCH